MCGGGRLLPGGAAANRGWLGLSLYIGCMSREVKELGFEIQALRLELQVLKLRVERQEAEIAELKAVQGFEFVQAPLEEGTSSERVPSEPSFSSQARSEPASSSQACPGDSASSDWSYRLEVARGIGQFLKAGFERRKWSGSSGRDKITLRSTIYVLVRDKGGLTYTNPVRVFKSWRGIKEHVESKGNLFDSLFVGFPSQREATVAVSEAGFQWPLSLEA